MKQDERAVKPRPRASRAESAARTRRRLLDSAGDVFAEVGFQAATVEAVVERAGYTRGAFYAHFTDKADILITLLEESREEDLARVREILATTEDEDTQMAVQAWYDELTGQGRWDLAYAELWPQAVRTPALRARLVARQNRVRSAISEMISDYCRTSGTKLGLPVHQVAGLMLALGDGIGAQRQLDPTALPPGAFTTATALLWSGLLVDSEVEPTNATGSAGRGV